jgi:hypothetical protein
MAGHREGWNLNRVIRLGFFMAMTITVLTVVWPKHANAADARFDLIGPKIEVRVTRAGVTLPIASVPNLQPGDRLWLHPDLPATPSVHYLLVLAFLRGTTNPPPDNWFIRIEAWDKKVREEGIEATIPDEAQQAVLLLAPVTGGDFATLRSAVQGRPGIFVRAAQDLNLAGFEQGRIEKYLASMREIPPGEIGNAKELQEHSSVIAGTLALKPNPDCMKLQPDQQYTCFTQSGNQSLLDDGHGQTIVAALSSGPGSDFINQASYTQLAGAGQYSAYVGAIVDLVRIMGSLHTAQYQYIPAIAFPQQQALNLRLNTPPSFHNPKSVLVIGLPAVQAATPPPLRGADPKSVACLLKPGMVLPVEGAPLVFSTGFAHDMILHIDYPEAVKTPAANSDPYRPGSPRPDALPQDIPLTPDAYKGGLVLAYIPKRRPLPLESVSFAATPESSVAELDDTAATDKQQIPARAASGLTGTIRGSWGFDPFTGPTMLIEDAPGKAWKLSGDGQLIAGKDRHILLTSTGTACIQSITLDSAASPTSSTKPQKESWKQADGPDTIDVALQLSAFPNHDPGALHLSIHQYGEGKPDTVSLVAYAEPAKLSALEFHAGDRSALLTGASLEEVRSVNFGGVILAPGQDQSSPAGAASLRLSLPANAAAPGLHPGDKATAQVILKDGRVLPLSFTVASQRPAVTILGKAYVASESKSKRSQPPSLAIHLSSPDDLPIADALLFSLKSAQPFPRSGKIEIASPDDALHATLTVAGEALIFEDPQTILAKLEPLKTFGPSAFGPLRLRPVAPDGSSGEWLPLTTIVRLPDLSGLSCSVASQALVPSTPKPTEVPVTAPTEPRAAPASSDQPATDAPPSSTAGAHLQPPAHPPASANLQSATCTLTGSSLYLIDSVAADPSFAAPTRVPQGFVGSSLSVPAPTGAVLYLRLRDDPTAVDTVTLPAGPL